MCMRTGCNERVKKSTAKYCSVRCCSIDPERRARLRESAYRSSHRVLPMARQLAFALSAQSDPEAVIERMCARREDLPRGMSRLSS